MSLSAFTGNECPVKYATGKELVVPVDHTHIELSLKYVATVKKKTKIYVFSCVVAKVKKTLLRTFCGYAFYIDNVDIDKSLEKCFFFLTDKSFI
jgi:hypothetical protein